MLLCALLLTAAPAAAQARSRDERSPLLAGVLQAAFPPLPLGYLYAGSFARGLVPTAVMVVGSSIFLVEVVQVIDWTDVDGSEPLIWVGLGMTFGGYVFGIVDAANVARNRNARLRAGDAAFRVLAAPSGVGLALSIPVG
jgi:hypothetical protein